MFTYATKSEKEETNSVSLSGEIVTEPTFSHEVFGESFFDVKLKRFHFCYDCVVANIYFSRGLRVYIACRFRC